MRALPLALLTLAVALPHARGGEAPQPGGKGSRAVGAVTSRLGNCAIVALDEGVAAKPGDVLLVSRPSLLIALAAKSKLLAAWADRKQVGRLRLRVPRGPRHWLALIEQDLPPAGGGDPPPPNILPGDRVYRLAGAAAPAPDAKNAAAAAGK